ncbi:lipopolysaccharide biosynthesis protein [Leptothermofonsia sp. ETS-13]|uniref:lipopolysaccharide biosynthesis protein n=1 Tax=Leptothermofonsia sp. ETS-13 TaxID=3035696 RepID=UPI003B9EE71C
MSIKQKAVKGVVWTTIQNWGSQAGSLIVFFILARLLQPQDFGLVALADVFLVFMQLLLEQGFAQAIIQRQELEPEHLDTAFWISLAIGMSLTLIGFASAGWVAEFLKQPLLAPILQCLSPVFVISAFSRVQQAILERQFAFKAIALRWLVGTIAGGAVGITLAFLGFGVWSLVIQRLVHEAIGTLMLWSASNWRPGFKVSMPHFRQLFGFGINIMGFNVLNFFNTRINDFLIGYFLGLIALGYYSVAYRVLTVMTQLLVRTSRDVALPTFSRLQTEPERFRRAFYTATQLTSTVAFPTFLGMATLAPELVLLLFGKQWQPSIPLMQILALMGMLRAVTFFKGSVFIAMGKPAWWFWLSVLNVVLNLIGFAIAIPFGIQAVAFAYVLRGYLAFPVGQWAVSRLIQDPLLLYLRQFITPLVSALVMATAILGAKQLLTVWLNPFGLLATCTFLGAMIHGLTIRLLAPQLFQQVLDLARLAVSRTNNQNA